MNKIYTIKLIDKFLGSFITYILPRKKFNKVNKDIKSILIIRPGGLGDAILLIPMIQKLNKIYPNAKIDILAEKRNAAAFKLLNFQCNIYCYDTISFFTVLKNKYDLVFDTEQWHFLSSIIARYVGKITIGFSTNKREKNFDIKVDYSHDIYEIDSFFNLLKKFCVEFKIDNINLSWSYPFIYDIQPFNKKYDMVIFTGASNEYRKWDIDKYITLIDRLKKFDIKMCLIGSNLDKIFNNKIAHSTQIDDYTGKTNLIDTARIICSSRLLFSTDSGILHLGAALGIKTVSLFGPGIEKKWAPKGSNHIVINKHYPCSPCTKFGYTPKCHYDNICIKDIGVDDVLTVIKNILINN